VQFGRFCTLAVIYFSLHFAFNFNHLKHQVAYNSS